MLDSSFAGFKFCWIQFLLDWTFERMHFDDGLDLDSIARDLKWLDSTFAQRSTNKMVWEADI